MVEAVHRLAQFEQHVVGDVHHRVDGADAGAAQAFAHPVRGARLGIELGDDAADVVRAALRVLDDHFAAGQGADHRRPHRRRLCRQVVERGDFARQAGDAETVAAIRRQLQAEEAVVQAQVLLDRRARIGVRVELQQAFGLFRQAQLGGGTEHAGGGHAAQYRRADFLAAGQHGAGQGGGHQQADASIGRAADDAQGFIAAGVDFADAQAIGLRMRLGLEDARHHHAARQLGHQRLGLAFQAG